MSVLEVTLPFSPDDWSRKRYSTATLRLGLTSSSTKRCTSSLSPTWTGLAKFAYTAVGGILQKSAWTLKLIASQISRYMSQSEEQTVYSDCNRRDGRNDLPRFG